MEKLVGLSLSLCIKDILDGKVKLEQVEKIVAGTKIASELNLIECLDYYRGTYWGNGFYGTMGVIIATRLWDAGKIEQPRLTNDSVTHSVAGGHWRVA